MGNPRLCGGWKVVARPRTVLIDVDPHDRDHHQALTPREPGTLVYFMVGSEGELLYVGVTSQPRTRWAVHAACQPWWDEVACLKVIERPTRKAALALERHMIETTMPPYNKALNPRARR